MKKNAFWVENYKSADLKYAYDGQPIVIFDLTRSMQEHFIVVVVGCHRWDTHACATCGPMYRREGWLRRHYGKLTAHDPGQSHLDEHSVTLTMNLLQLLFRGVRSTGFSSLEEWPQSESWST